MEVWTGKITFDDSKNFEDVHFVDARGSSSFSFPSDAKLQFLSLVEVAAIPLHLAGGPSLNVWTPNETTEQWLAESLLDDWKVKEDSTEFSEPWWLQPIQQSDRGILLKVENPMGNTTGPERNVTEFLIYAAISKEAQIHATLPTPPGSSSPNARQDIHVGTSNGTIQDIKIYALPLCSMNSTLVDDIGGLASPPFCDKSADVEARFLPPSFPYTAYNSTSPRKRQRIANMFEDVTYQKKRLMRHGGDRISKAMAAINGGFITNEKLMNPNVEEDKDVTSTDQPKFNLRNEQPRGLLSRASSVSSLRGDESSRPPSRRGHLLNAKRSSLIRVESIASMGESSQISESSAIEQQNKSALTRIVMTGMRIYGLQQRKKSPKSRLEPEMEERPVGESTRPVEEEDDYKLIYHQTFKAASFTFRTHMSLEIINQEVLRDVVDSLLVIFCNDPLAHTTNDPFCAEGGKDDVVAVKAFNRASTGTALAGDTDGSCVPLTGKENGTVQNNVNDSS